MRASQYMSGPRSPHMCVYGDMFIYIYIYIPRTQITSIFEGQAPKTRPFPIKTRVIWVPGIYIYIHMYIDNYIYPIDRMIESMGFCRIPHPTTPLSHLAMSGYGCWWMKGWWPVTEGTKRLKKNVTRHELPGQVFFFIGQLTRWWFFAVVALSLLLFTYVQSHIVLLGQVKRYFA